MKDIVKELKLWIYDKIPFHDSDKYQSKKIDGYVFPEDTIISFPKICKDCIARLPHKDYQYREPLCQGWSYTEHWSKDKCLQVLMFARIIQLENKVEELEKELKK